MHVLYGYVGMHACFIWICRYACMFLYGYVGMHARFIWVCRYACMFYMGMYEFVTRGFVI